MRIPSVSLYIRINDEKGRRYERIHRRNPQICAPQDVYAIHYYENGKRKWVSVGTDLSAANAARGQKEQELALQSKEKSEPPKPSPAKPKTLEELRTAFITDRKTTIKKDGSPLDPDTIRSYENETRRFLDTVNRCLPTEITRQDLKTWMMKLRQGDETRKALSHRTVCNLYVSIVCFLHYCGVDHKRLLPQSERPTPVEQTPEAYTAEEMTRFFFNVVNERDALAFEFLLKTGAREREMTELEWRSFELGATPTVRFGSGTFCTKTGKSRVVPLERELATKLAAWRVKHPATRFVFGTDDRVEGHYLRICKAIAKRAGMGQDNFWLHKFRDTFATWSLQSGVDIRTVQHWPYRRLRRSEDQIDILFAPAGCEVALAIRHWCICDSDHE
jgi:integrase/recombinase XerD